MGCKITRSLHVNTVLSHFIKIVGPIAESFITDFEEYKKECVEFGDIPIPPHHVQLTYPAHIETIGRDKRMERPRTALHEELHHVHLWQDGCNWDDENEGTFVQWNSTSDSFIVYSYFKDKDNDHHFYIIDLVFDQAHTIIEDKEQVLKWVKIAKEFRLKNI